MPPPPRLRDPAGHRRRRPEEGQVDLGEARLGARVPGHTDVREGGGRRHRELHQPRIDAFFSE